MDKKKLLIGGGLLLLLVIVIIALMVMGKKTPQQHAADAKDAANMAIMHSNIAQAAANSPNNSAKASTVKNAMNAANQASAQSNASAKQAAAGSAPAYVFPTQSVILNPTASGKYYITHGNKFLNTQNYNLEDTPKTPINLDITTSQATNPDGSPLTLFGQNVLIFPVKNANSVVTGIVINQVPTSQTYFPVSEDGTKITAGVYSFPSYDTRLHGDTIQGPNDPYLATANEFLYGLLPAQ